MLDELFEKWKSSESVNSLEFAMDGIIDETLWHSAPRKVLYLLKETNNFRSDLRILVKENPWKVIGHWTYALCNVQNGNLPSFSDADNNHNEFCNMSAILNLKKETGSSSADNDEVRRIAERDKELILEQLEIINPDIVVCGGTFHLIKDILITNSDPIDKDRRCYRINDTFWIDFCHPSARFRHDMMYYTLTNLFHTCLT